MTDGERLIDMNVLVPPCCFQSAEGKVARDILWQNLK